MRFTLLYDGSLGQSVSVGQPLLQPETTFQTQFYAYILFEKIIIPNECLLKDR
jgi:hypothetical protein